MRGVLIGVDVGTTVLKAAAFDVDTGQLLAKAVSPLRVKVGRDGARELSPSSLDRAMVASFSRLRTQLEAREWNQVVGIGLAGQGGSALIADRQTGRALTRMMLWNDVRAFKFMPRVKGNTSESFWRERTLRDEPGWGLARILFLRETRPELLNPDNIYVGAGEYCYFQMTGLWRQDVGNALQIGCYNAVHRRLDQQLMDVVDLPLSFVAPTRVGHQTNPLSELGSKRLQGLPVGIPVAGPYMDHEAGYLSAAGSSRRPLQCSLGTAWVGNFVLSPNSKWTSPFQLVLPAVVGNGWLVVQPLLTGNVTWNWALERFVARDMKRALRKLDKIFSHSLLPPRGLTALPWLNMPNPLVSSAVGAGAFFGINPSTDGAQLLRALAAAMVYEMARVLWELKTRRTIDTVVLGGGASKGAFFRSLLSAMFDPLPVVFVKEEDLSGTRGALWVFSKEVAAAKTKPVTMPDGRTRGRIAEGYELYLSVFTRIYGDSPLGAPVSFQASQKNRSKKR